MIPSRAEVPARSAGVTSGKSPEPAKPFGRIAAFSQIRRICYSAVQDLLSSRRSVIVATDRFSGRGTPDSASAYARCQAVCCATQLHFD